jgi:hypothetical protein
LHYFNRQDTLSQILEDSEVLALLFPEPPAGGKPSGQVTAFVQDAGGNLALHTVVPDSRMLQRARVAGRHKSGKPIIDPATREIIGYELAPMAVA